MKDSQKPKVTKRASNQSVAVSAPIAKSVIDEYIPLCEERSVWLRGENWAPAYYTHRFIPMGIKSNFCISDGFAKVVLLTQDDGFRLKAGKHLYLNIMTIEVRFWFARFVKSVNVRTELFHLIT